MPNICRSMKPMNPLPLTMTTFIKYRSFPKLQCTQHRYAERNEDYGGDEQHEPLRGDLCKHHAEPE